MRNLLVLLLVGCFWSTNAWAQESAVPLVSVIDASSVTDVAPWWVLDVPQYSEFDRTLSASTPQHFKWAWSDELTKVSKVLRRAELSDANAVALASVLGGKYALVGTIHIGKLPRIGPFDPEGVRAQLSARLLTRTPKGVAVVRQFTYESVSFSQADTRGDALRKLADDVRVGVDDALRPGPKALGATHAETVIVLRNIDHSAQLEAIRTRLLSHPVVDDVAVVWAAPGALALAINAKVEDAHQTVLRVAEMLSVSFETFVLTPQTAMFEKSLEFEVQAQP